MSGGASRNLNFLRDTQSLEGNVIMYLSHFPSTLLGHQPLTPLPAMTSCPAKALLRYSTSHFFSAGHLRTRGGEGVQVSASCCTNRV